MVCLGGRGLLQTSEPIVPPESHVDPEPQSDAATLVGNAEVAVDLAIQMAKDQLSFQFSASSSLDGKMATILGFMAVFGALVLGTKWRGFVVIGLLPVLLTVGCCLGGLLYGNYEAGPDPKQFYEAVYASEPIIAKQQLLSELQRALIDNRRIGINKSVWLMCSIAGVIATLIAVSVLYLRLGGG